MSSTGILTIDLTALKANWNYLSQKVGDEVICAAVVKANAYGLGVDQVANSLYEAGCRAFFVATLLEAKTLRQQLHGDYRIFVLGGLCHDVSDTGISDDWENLQLTPVLISREQVIKWADYCVKDACLPSVIKVDTGMHRLGLSPGEVKELLVSGFFQKAKPEYIMSHFACADAPDHTLNAQQLICLNECLEQVVQYMPSLKVSFANSSGIFLGSETHFQMVRPGAALYGVNPAPANPNPMSQVVSLSLPVMQVKLITKGESVGYGAEFVAQYETRVAIVFGGYADGLFRALGGKGFAFFEEQAFPIIGRISMDSFAIDVTHADKDVIKRMQFVELLNDKQTIDCLAKHAATIGYEILTSLGARYQRRYLK